MISSWYMLVPVLLPIGEGPEFRGVVNVLEKKAYEGAYKKSVEVPMPDNMVEKVNKAFDDLVEALGYCIGEWRKDNQHKD